MPNKPVDPATLPTGAGEPVHVGRRVWLSPAEARRMSASVESLAATMPEALADLSGAIEGTKSGWSSPIQTSFGAFGTASGSSAIYMGLHRKSWRTLCGKAGGPEPSEQESKMTQGTRLRKGSQHTTPKLSPPVKLSINWRSW